MAIDFGKSGSNKMINNVMKRAEETSLDNKKRDIPLDQIDLDPDNERLFGYRDIDYLADQIGESGFHGAIEVYPTENGRYMIIAGHRRYLACQQLGFETIPCIVSEYMGDKATKDHQIMSNFHHRDMTPLEIAKNIDVYDKEIFVEKKVDYKGKKRQAIAKKFNMSEATIQRYQGILKLIPEFQELCNDKEFHFSYYTNPIQVGTETKSVAMEPEEIQRELYHNLLEIAPEGKINELSKRTIEIQFESVLAKAQRLNIVKIKQSESVEQKEKQDNKAVDMPEGSLLQDDLEEDESIEFVSHNFADDAMEDMEEGDVYQADKLQELPDLDLEDITNEPSAEAVDDKLLFYIGKIKEIVTADVVYEDKERIIDQMRDALNRLEK